jgi:CubicO group peptidase (beta-lactamase class C family)
MLKKLLPFIFFSLLPAALFAQKKSKPVQPVHAVRSTGVPAVTVLSAERKLRLTRREEALKSIVLLKNEAHLLPLGRLDTLRILVVGIDIGKVNPFPQLIGRFIKADYLYFHANTKADPLVRNLTKSHGYNLVIFAIGEVNRSTTTEGQTSKENLSDVSEAESQERYLKQVERILPGSLTAGTKTVLMLFGAPSSLTRWEIAATTSALVVTERADFDRLDLSTQLLFGAIHSSGKLAFDLNNFRRGDGIAFPGVDRLGYVIPEEVGMDSVKLTHRMDSLVEIGLKQKAYPGCQLILAKKGKVFYQKSYGFHTYENAQPVQNDDVYDLASVTKILAPVPALMILADQKKFLVTKKMSEYWPDWKGSNKEGILVSDLLSHQARLRSGVVLWPGTVDAGGRPRPEYYAMQPKTGYELRVSENLYLINSYPDTVYKVIRDSRLLKTKKYEYSDLGFVILPKVIEHLAGVPYERFLRKELYDRLGASTLTYQPYLSDPMAKIVPTEDDQAFRHELLQGFVHDETAALLGGVSGNAGLFGSAGDVAKIMQLYLQHGEYGNERYIKAETVANWTSSHFKKTNNRRGFGFDKPGIQVNRYTGKERYPSRVVSEQSYGHSGYTGTFVWADPANDLLFVFLSNRVFPDRDNHKINKLRLRPLLLENFFQLAGDKPEPH